MKPLIDFSAFWHYIQFIDVPWSISALVLAPVVLGLTAVPPAAASASASAAHNCSQSAWKTYKCRFYRLTDVPRNIPPDTTLVDLRNNLITVRGLWPLADPRSSPGTLVPGVLILSFSCSFLAKNLQNNTNLRVGAPTAENLGSATADYPRTQLYSINQSYQ